MARNHNSRQKRAHKRHVECVKQACLAQGLDPVTQVTRLSTSTPFMVAFRERKTQSHKLTAKVSKQHLTGPIPWQDADMRNGRAVVKE